MTRDKDDNKRQDSEASGSSATPQDFWEESDLALKDAFGATTPAEKARLISLMGLGRRVSNTDPQIIFMTPRGTDLEVTSIAFNKSQSTETVPDFFPPPPVRISKFRTALNWARSKIGRPAR